MPRVSGVYSPPSGTFATTLTTISSSAYNTFVNDLVTDANAVRPTAAGGTGLATMPANTVFGNFTGSAAAPTSGDASAVRASIGAPAVPVFSAGAGQIVFINPGLGTNYTLPAGGSWLNFRCQIDNTGIYRFVHSFDILAGGTSLGAPSASVAWVGWAWRIA